MKKNDYDKSLINRILIQRASGSTWKKSFWSLKENDEVWLRGPGTQFSLDESRPAVMLTGGVGVTPFKCMLEHAAESQIPTKVIASRVWG